MGIVTILLLGIGVGIAAYLSFQLVLTLLMAFLGAVSDYGKE